jgi:hypothetical protein
MKVLVEIGYNKDDNTDMVYEVGSGEVEDGRVVLRVEDILKWALQMMEETEGEKVVPQLYITFDEGGEA